MGSAIEAKTYTLFDIGLTNYVREFDRDCETSGIDVAEVNHGYIEIQESTVRV